MVRALLILALAACHHDRPPQGPPPSSTGTPIGYLIDSAGELHLRDDQVAMIRSIDTTLRGRLIEIAGTGTGTGSGSSSTRTQQPPRMRMTGGRRRRTAPNPAAVQPHKSDAADKLAASRNLAVHTAVEHALDSLDPDQRAAAAKILVDHDIDVDDAAETAPPPTIPAPGS